MKKIFTLIAIAMTATCAMAGNHVVKLTHAAAKENPWDTQIFFKLENLESNKTYKVSFDVKASEPVKISTEEIDDVQTEHKDPYGGSAIFNYSENVDVTTEWTTGCATFKGICKSDCKTEGHETHENFEFAATAILLGVGKVPGEIWFDNIVVTDEDGNEVYKNDFENGARVAAYDTSADGHYPGWQLDKGEGMWEIEEEADPDDKNHNHVLEINTVAKDKPWDSQLRIFFGDKLEAGKKYTMTMQVISDEDMTISTEFIQEPAPNNCKDQYGGSWFFEYAASMDSKTEWSTVQSWINGTVSNNNEDCAGHDEPVKHTGETYKPTYAYLTFGLYTGTFQIDNVTITDEDGAIVYQNDFEENLLGISTPSWHEHIKMSRPVNENVPEFNIPTAISNVAVESAKTAKTAKALKNGQIVITRGAKAYNAVGQEL